jgi:L-galactose dehydrogenase
MATGHSEAHAVSVVRHALDLGINFIDTARGYGTEPAVGKAIKGRRETVVLSTKVSPGRGDARLTPAQLIESLEKSLARLATDYIDVFHCMV